MQFWLVLPVTFKPKRQHRAAKTQVHLGPHAKAFFIPAKGREKHRSPKTRAAA
jgi:hypothetical protein